MTVTKEEVLEALKQGVINYDEDAVKEAARKALEIGMDAYDAVFDGLVVGMQEVGRLYEEQEYFVPEMLMCADALYAGLEVLRPYLEKRDLGVKGAVIIGVVEGDVHDIGKNLVKIMFEVGGFDVYDLGRDVPLSQFVEEQLRTDAELVCLSAMMTTTMVGMKEVIDKIKSRNPSVQIMVGGAPLSEDIAEKWGADGYAKDATHALNEAIKLISSLKDIRKAAAAEGL